MPNYRRYRVSGGAYFFNVNLLERQQDTLVRHIDILRNAVRKKRNERPFNIDAWVVLPDHKHCIWTLPEGDDDFSNRWKAIKTCHELVERYALFRHYRERNGVPKSGF